MQEIKKNIMVSFIEISLKSYETKLIENAFQQIINCKPDSWRVNSFNFPNKIKKITVLRSPHIDKKSREQFQMKIFKKNIICHIAKSFEVESIGSSGILRNRAKPLLRNPCRNFQSIKNVALFLENIKQCSFSGVQVQIQIFYSSYL
jgi:ribosomal protein S10